MDDTTFKILDTLSRETGRSLSINELTKKISEIHGKAYYANVYRKLQELNKEGIIGQSKTGRSSIPVLKLQNYFTTVRLTEMELKRTYELLRKRSELQTLFADIDERFRGLPFIRSVATIDPEKNLRLNRVELLMLLQDTGARNSETAAIYNTAQALQTTHNIKTDGLALGRKQFFDLLKADERNPLKAMLWDKAVVFHPEAFWTDMAAASEEGIRIRRDETETNPAKITEQDLAYNLARFGYREFGAEIKQGENICIEYTVAALLMRRDARRFDAVPVILSKNRPHYNILIFLCQKHGLSDRLLGVLNALNNIRPSTEVGEAIKTLKMMRVKGTKMNERTIRAKMRLYNVT